MSEKKAHEAGERVYEHKDLKNGGCVIGAVCLITFLLDVAFFAWNIIDMYMSPRAFLPHDLKVYYIFFVVSIAVGGLLFIIYAVSFFATLSYRAFNGETWHVFNAVVYGLMLVFDICIVSVYWVAQLLKDCVIAARPLSPVGWTSIGVTMISAILRVFIVIWVNRNKGKLSQSGKTASTIAYIFLLCGILASGLASIGTELHASASSSVSNRPVFLTQMVMPFCYKVERQVALFKGVENIIPPPRSAQEREDRKDLRSVAVSCCRFYQKVYVGSLHEIVNASSEGIIRRVRCQDAFPFMNYLVLAEDLPLLDTHDCTLVVRMHYDKSRASLMYNSGLELRSKTEPMSCVIAGSTLEKEYGRSATRVDRASSVKFTKAVASYECPDYGDPGDCPRILGNDYDDPEQTFTSIQPKDLTSHIGCYTSANMTKSLDLGLCQGPPGLYDSQPYPTVTSCIDDFEEIEAKPYLDYGTH